MVICDWGKIWHRGQEGPSTRWHYTHRRWSAGAKLTPCKEVTFLFADNKHPQHCLAASGEREPDADRGKGYFCHLEKVSFAWLCFGHRSKSSRSEKDWPVHHTIVTSAHLFFQASLTSMVIYWHCPSQPMALVVFWLPPGCGWWSHPLLWPQGLIRGQHCIKGLCHHPCHNAITWQRWGHNALGQCKREQPLVSTARAGLGAAQTHRWGSTWGASGITWWRL